MKSFLQLARLLKKSVFRVVRYRNSLSSLGLRHFSHVENYPIRAAELLQSSYRVHTDCV